MQIKAIKTKSEARQFVIDWQSWQSKKSLSYAEISKWSCFFTFLGKKYNLIKEFKENGIC